MFRELSNNPDLPKAKELHGSKFKCSSQLGFNSVLNIDGEAEKPQKNLWTDPYEKEKVSDVDRK